MIKPGKNVGNGVENISHLVSHDVHDAFNYFVKITIITSLHKECQK